MSSLRTPSSFVSIPECTFDMWYEFLNKEQKARVDAAMAGWKPVDPMPNGPCACKPCTGFAALSLSEKLEINRAFDRDVNRVLEKAAQDMDSSFRGIRLSPSQEEEAEEEFSAGKSPLPVLKRSLVVDFAAGCSLQSRKRAKLIAPGAAKAEAAAPCNAGDADYDDDVQIIETIDLSSPGSPK